MRDTMEVRTLITSPESSVVENLDSDHRRFSYFTEYVDMKMKLKKFEKVSEVLTHQIFHSMLGSVSSLQSQ